MNKTSQFFVISTVLSVLFSCTGSDGGVVNSGQEPDPVVVDFPIAYIKRPLPVEVDDNGNETPVMASLREPVGFNPGAALYIRDRATPSASETNITAQAFEADALYDVKDIEVSYDGNKLLFAMRAPELEDVDEEDQPKWNIWEYDRTTQVLRRVIASDITAEAGDDVAPHYLPDGRIVFASTRQRLAKAVLLDEGKPQFSALEEDRRVEALALHVMKDDGSEITQITFNQSHDMDPTVLDNGKVVFSRWDNVAPNNTINLYQVNPDGTGLEILYGRHSHDSGTDGATIEFISPRQVEDGRLLTHLKPAVTSRLGGELAYVDWQNFIDINQPVSGSSISGAGHVTATPFEVRSDDEPSIGGRFASVYPLYDGSSRLLISWSPCRLDEMDDNNNPIIVECTTEKLAEAGAVEAQPLYGVWIYNPADQTQLPIVIAEESVVTHEVVALAPRNLPTVIADSAPSADVDLVSENVGIVHIKSVYDFDGQDMSPTGITALADPAQTLAADRPSRFLRIVKAVSMPDDDLVELDGTAFGRNRGQLMRDILGYARVEPDGSAMFKVPANVAFYISVLDANGQRIGGRHQNWMSVKAGEVKQCNGCHTRTSELPHGRMEAEAASINLGAPVTGSPFPNTSPALFADQGETMAEVYSRLNGYQTLSVNINYDDVWTDPVVRTPDTSFSYSYSDLRTPSPTTLGCLTDWNGLCRITINYPDVIQPIWNLTRQVLDNDGNLVQDNTCVSCHSQTDAMGQLQVPLGQLELVDTPSIDEPDHLTSYRELMFNDNELVIMNGALVDLLLPATDANGNPVYEVDADGNLILDANGDPIPVMEGVNVQASMSSNSALASQRFFQVFNSGGSHEGWLSPAELKLISEWLDIGGQYYNNPFDVPQ
ncbi:HzsA-related protein [Aliikangiella sp. IMCC44359]|uniref:HzsA-related protein n=1 Tax=Aliikangiella sp. IMCC44359 TaxID=3459125 RepID=UPI00403B0CBA